jgi:predicted RNA methylase
VVNRRIAGGSPDTRAPGLEPGMRVLEVGSGAGDVALLAAELVGPEGEVVGVEVDGAALKVARGRAQSLGLRNVSFVQGDARTSRTCRVHASRSFGSRMARSGRVSSGREATDP